MIRIDLCCVWGSKITWFDASASKLTWVFLDVRPQRDMEASQRDVLDMFQNTTYQSPLTEQLSGLSFINEQNR